MLLRSPPRIIQCDMNSEAAKLLSHRLIFVAGKGGSGKTTVTAALASLAGKHGKRVLAVDMDGKGDLGRALGIESTSFSPVVAQHNVSVMTLNTEDALHEYLRRFFKLPRFTRFTPLAPVLEFVATAIPGIKDVLLIGKVVFEQQRIEDGKTVWDIVIVDSPATGHIVPQLNTPRAIRSLARGGMLQGQIEGLIKALSDEDRTALGIVVTPEEMSVIEAHELFERVTSDGTIAPRTCVVNRVLPLATAGLPLLPLKQISPYQESYEDFSGVLALAAEIEVSQNEMIQSLAELVPLPQIQLPFSTSSRTSTAAARALTALLEKGP